MSGLRFCFLTTFYPPFSFGGDAIAVRRLAHGLARAGHHVTIVHDADAFRALSPLRPGPEDEPEPSGIEVVRLESALGPLSVVLTQQLGRPVVHGRRIAALLRGGAFDVIHFHNISLVGGPGLLKYGDAVKLYTAHEHWLVCPTHVLWRHGRELCTGRECLRCQLAYRRPPQLWRHTNLLGRELHHVDQFLAMSEFSRRKHIEFGFPKEMAVLPAFLPGDERVPERAADSAADPARANAPHPRPFFLFVGRLERLKGVEDLFAHFSGDGAADLLIVGDGTHAAALRARAAQLPRVRFLGRVPNEQLAPYYRHALGLLVPSQCFETFGIVIVEAFRQGVPVIARHIGPYPELVATSGGGVTFSSDAELAEAMDRLRTDPALRDRLGAAGRAAFERHWTETVVIPQYLELVRAAAARKGGSRVPAVLGQARSA